MSDGSTVLLVGLKVETERVPVRVVELEGVDARVGAGPVGAAGDVAMVDWIASVGATGAGVRDAGTAAVEGETAVALDTAGSLVANDVRVLGVRATTLGRRGALGVVLLARRSVGVESGVATEIALAEAADVVAVTRDVVEARARLAGGEAGDASVAVAVVAQASVAGEGAHPLGGTDASRVGRDRVLAVLGNAGHELYAGAIPAHEAGVASEGARLVLAGVVRVCRDLTGAERSLARRHLHAP